MWRKTSALMFAVVVIAACSVGFGGCGGGKKARAELTPWKLPDFVVNLADDAEPHYVKTSLVLEVYGEPEKGGGEGEEAVNIQEAKVQDTIIRILSRKYYLDLLKPEGKTRLVAELKSGLNESLKEYDIEVENVLFTSFALQ